MDFPLEIPRQPLTLGLTANLWPRAYLAVAYLATTGYAIRYELQMHLNAHYGEPPESRQLRHVMERKLPQTGLIIAETFHPFQNKALTAVRLTPKGETLCREWGLDVVESEWARLIRLHTGAFQPAHTGAVLAFLSQARRRGWQTQVVPTVDAPRVYPDVMIEKDERRIYVEVELSTQKYTKWQHLAAFQGLVAICAKTPASRLTLQRECEELGLPGSATDLETLHRRAKEPPYGSLWEVEWGACPGGL